MYICYATRDCKIRTFTMLAVSVVSLVVTIPSSYFLSHFGYRLQVVEKICTISSVVVFISPLWDMVRVVKTRNAEFMSFWLSLALTVSGAAWSVYGLAAHEYSVVMVDNNWTVKLHHGGQFVDKPRKAYVKGKVAVFNGMEEDKMSLPEFWDMGKELNYPSPRSYNYYYKIPKLSMAKGLVLLETDMDVLKMLECHLDTYVISAYMVPPDVAAEVQEVHAKNAPVNEEAGDGQPDANDDGMSLGNDEQEDNIVPEELDNQEEAVFMEELDEAGTDEEQNSDNDVIDEGVNKITFGDEEEDHRLDSDIEDDVYRLVDDFVQRAEPDKDGRGSRHNEDDVPVAVSDDEENGSREYDSDELRSIDGSGEDQDISKYVLYREPTKPQEKPILKVGMKFVDARQFRKALRSHAVLSGYDIHFKKNEGGRVTCVCKESQESKKEGEIGCKWRIHASWNDEESAFIIKTYNPDHGCSRVFENTQATSAVLSNMYIENLRDDPDWKLSAMQKAVHWAVLEVVLSEGKVVLSTFQQEVYQ
ncbi:hypothetical protein CASFOL_019688 [Castilleja foliolosa]|uniref:Transposase MuDR plant domain-containing protein n=1 Tax=Castilleja foliolosa TaxID=1961234 RepID=A0ABD3D291_9LAMI